MTHMSGSTVQNKVIRNNCKSVQNQRLKQNIFGIHISFKLSQFVTPSHID